jgi:hypothetical protein
MEEERAEEEGGGGETLALYFARVFKQTLPL